MSKCTRLISALVGAAVVVVLPGAVLAGGQTSQDMEPAPSAEEEHPEDIDYSDQIVWNSYAPNEALFLPQSVLDTTPVEALPLSQSSIHSIRESLRFLEADRQQGRPDPCSDAYEDPMVREMVHSASTIQEWIASQNLAFVGSVVDTVPGLGTWGKPRPVTVVYVQVEEILGDEDGSPQFGQVLAYFQEHARIDLYGIEDCSKLPPEADLAEVGERFLFTGTRYSGHEFFLSPSYVFPVRGHEVLPLSWTPHFRHAEPAALETVRDAIRGEDG